jgi:sterol desaturase/sphingolipid hydroxylase (fatty acid hydroxylase superfamily)
MENVPKLFFLLLPIFLIASLLEALYLKIKGRHYPWRESGSTLMVWAIQRIINFLLGGGALWLMMSLSKLRLFTIEMNSALAWLALFFGLEFFYYWHHRFSHTVRWFWATHAVHHTPNHIVLWGAIRLGWTGTLTGVFLFYAPLVLIGFPPKAVLMMLGINLIYQFWLHTELVPKLGWLETIFNTPSHHRVHHGSNTEYLDRNYGGILIIFDRLFNTLAVEDEKIAIRYGLTKPLNSNNPFFIALHEWLAIARDIRSAQSFNEALQYLYKAPGWKPEIAATSVSNLLPGQTQQGHTLKPQELL